MHQDLVVGSGPASVSAAHALLDRGRRVMMLDVGLELEPDNSALKAQLGSREPGDWNANDVALMKQPQISSDKGATIKPFRSDFATRDAVGFFAPPGPPRNVELRPSFAKGGLSNGWGASILPYRTEDLGDWPAISRELGPHYQALRSFMPMSAVSDRLQELFPLLPVESTHCLPMSSQGRALLERLDRRRDRLEAAGVFHGRARQAVASDCRQCSMCLYGCPYDLIFNAGGAVNDLKQREGFSYRPGIRVTKFDEGTDDVTVSGRDVQSGANERFIADRVFVGAGVLPTAQIVLSSLNVYDRPIVLKDSQHFFLPMLHRWRPKPDPASEARHTLTQIFLEILDREISASTIHVQVYAHNDLYAADMRKRFGAMAGAMNPLIEILSRRLIVTQSFLHSDLSPSIELTLKGGPDASHLAFAVVDNAETATVVSRTVRKLARMGVGVGLAPLVPLVRYGNVGSSFHCGGTFPMSEHPSGLQSDTLGRPAGLQRTYLIDASTFPTIPATTITLSVMANAHRIASSAP